MFDFLLVMAPQSSLMCHFTLAHALGADLPIHYADLARSIHFGPAVHKTWQCKLPFFSSYLNHIDVPHFQVVKGCRSIGWWFDWLLVENISFRYSRRENFQLICCLCFFRVAHVKNLLVENFPPGNNVLKAMPIAWQQTNYDAQCIAQCINNTELDVRMIYEYCIVL